MKFIVSFLLLCLCNNLFCQRDSIVYATYLNNGQKKKVLYSRGIDTMEYIKYYKNGHVRDSSWFYLKDNVEVNFGVSKKYFENGRLSTITYYGPSKYEYKTISYWRDGRVYMEAVNPGITKYYNKAGEVIKQMDMNGTKDIYIPDIYKQQKHLIDGGYVKRMSQKKVVLVNHRKQIKLKTNTLISIVLNNDTSVITHCKLEGATADSIYISKFNYNYLFDGSYEHPIMNYDSTFVLNIKQLKTIYYSKHYNGKRNLGAFITYLSGIELMALSLLTTPFIAKDPQLGLTIFGGMIIIGYDLIKYSTYLYKTMIPKKYDLPEWQIKLRG